VGFLGNFFNGNNNNGDNTTFEATPNRGPLKDKLRLNLYRRGFTEMEVNEIIDVITLAEADIKVAEDSLNHININNPDPTRAMHAALEDIRKYQKELEYNVRKKIMEIMARKKAMKR